MYIISSISGYFAIVLALAGFAGLAWKRFSWAVVAVLTLLPLAAVRFYVGAVPLSIVEAMALILAVRFTTQALGRQFWADARSVVAPIALPVAAIIAGLAIVTLQSSALRSSLGAAKELFVIPILFGFVIAVAVRRGEVRMGQVCAGLIAGGAGVALGATLQLVAGNLTSDQRLAAWYDSPALLAMYLVPLMVLAFGLGWRGSGLAAEWRTLSRWAGVLMTVPVLASRSWGAIGAVALAFVVWLWFGRRRRAAAAVLLAALIALFVWQALKPEFATRLTVWQGAFEIGREHPFTGIGPGAFAQAYLAHQPHKPPYFMWPVFHPHNLFLALWLGTGALGIAGFVGLIGILTRRLLAALKNPNSAPFTVAIGLALTVPVVHGLIDTTLWRGELAIVWWVLVGVILAV